MSSPLLLTARRPGVPKPPRRLVAVPARALGLRPRLVGEREACLKSKSVVRCAKTAPTGASSALPGMPTVGGASTTATCVRRGPLASASWRAHRDEELALHSCAGFPSQTTPKTYAGLVGGPPHRHRYSNEPTTPDRGAQAVARSVQPDQSAHRTHAPEWVGFLPTTSSTSRGCTFWRSGPRGPSPRPASSSRTSSCTTRGRRRTVCGQRKIARTWSRPRRPA